MIRLSITTYSYGTVLSISEDNVGTIARKTVQDRKLSTVRAFLATNGYTVVGDMRQVGDRTLTQRVVKI